MGSFSYIGPALTQAAQGDIARQRQLADQQRQTKLALLMQSFPNTTDEGQRDALLKGIGALYPTPVHAPQFLTDLLHLKGRQQSPQQQGQQGQSAAPPATPATPDASAPIPTGPRYNELGDDISGGSTNELGGYLPPRSSAPEATPATPQPASPDLSGVRQVAQAPTAADALKAIAAVPSPVQTQRETLEMQAANAQKLAGLNNAARLQEAVIRMFGNVGMQKLDAAAQSLGADSFATADPDIKMKAMQALHQANVTPTWKAVTDGNNIYAVDAHNPSGQRTLIGHKDDLTSHSEWKTMTNTDGSTFLVPVTTWTKKGSSQPILETQGDAGEGAPVSANTPSVPGIQPTPEPSSPAPAAPVSSATPAGPGATSSIQPVNAGARAPGTKPSGGAVKNRTTAASSAGQPGLPKGAIPFGGKPNELQKADAAQYTKLAEDANAKQAALNSAQIAARSPSASSDKELVYSWVRSNVQGAGRMTQYEFTNGLSTGSFDQRVQNWWSLATTGKMTPEIRSMLLADIQRAASTAQSMAADARRQVEQDMHPQSTPRSTQTPSGPVSKPRTAADYLQSIGS